MKTSIEAGNLLIRNFMNEDGNYHSDWNALMGAWHKFRAIDIDSFDAYGFNQFQRYRILISDNLRHEDKGEVFATLVEAITWLNNN